MAIVGEETSTAADVTCLIRSGAKDKECTSLTKDAASFLRQRFKHIKDVTKLSFSSDSSSSDCDTDEWEPN